MLWPELKNITHYRHCLTFLYNSGTFKLLGKCVKISSTCHFYQFILKKSRLHFSKKHSWPWQQPVTVVLCRRPGTSCTVNPSLQSSRLSAFSSSTRSDVRWGNILWYCGGSDEWTRLCFSWWHLPPCHLAHRQFLNGVEHQEPHWAATISCSVVEQATLGMTSPGGPGLTPASLHVLTIGSEQCYRDTVL